MPTRLHNVMRSYGTILTFITPLIFGALLSACGPEVDVAREAAAPVQAVADAPRTATYEVRGRIVEIQDGGATLLVDHEEIRGYMAAMTMPFPVRDVAETRTLSIGDPIAFVYHVTDDGMWISGIERLDSDEIGASPSADAEPEYGDHADGSLYWLGESWTNQQGDAVRLADFEGRPVVMSMVFTHCGYACPMIVRDMKRIGKQLPGEATDDVQYVLVSLDPDRDTPEQMQRFASAHRLDPDQWTILRGSKSQVRMLAAALGIRYRKESDGQFAHSNLVSILDAAGEIVHQQRGLENDGEASARVITELLAAR